jgi:Arylsulfatase A and related enzymes
MMLPGRIHPSRSAFGKVFLLLIALSFSCSEKAAKNSLTPETKTSLPNIIVFYVDDLGYGDLGCYGAKGVETPNIDSLASKGIRFTDAHSTAATCTPSRYSMITGRYAFRNNAAILPGDAPLLIQPGSYTIPSMLKKAGYKTGVIGKWHLGLGNGTIDWNGEIKPGPLEIGFDYSFILPATGDRVPSVYLENYRVVNHSAKDEPIVVNYEMKLEGYPNGLDNPEKLRQKADKQHSNTIVNGISRIGYMKGGESALWVDEDFPEVLSGKATKFMSDAKSDPFFLYFSFHDIHVPRLPNEKFKGKSTMGPRGDVIAQMDWITGEVMNQLKKLGKDENTIIIFTSDNGPVLNDGYEDQSDERLGDHLPAGPFRGGKYSAYEAGTRVPMIVYWPGKTSTGTSRALISQVDLYASLAALTDQSLASDEAIDSKNILPTLLDPDQKGRDVLLEESFTMSLRRGEWKYIEPFTKEKKLPNFMKSKGVEGGFEYYPQLFNLDQDINERTNVADKNADMVKELQAEIDKIRSVNRRDAKPE